MWPWGAAGCLLMPAGARLAPPHHGPGAAQHGLPEGAGGLFMPAQGSGHPQCLGCPKRPCEHQEVLCPRDSLPAGRLAPYLPCHTGPLCSTSPP